MNLGEIRVILNTALLKATNLTAVSFGKFTPARLPEDYLYQKWKGFDKDFGRLFLNMDMQGRKLFMIYSGQTEEKADESARILSDWLRFACNFNTSEYHNPFEDKRHGKLFCKMATGKLNPSWIYCKDVIKCYLKGSPQERLYLVACCFNPDLLKEKAQEENDLPF